MLDLVSKNAADTTMSRHVPLLIWLLCLSQCEWYAASGQQLSLPVVIDSRVESLEFDMHEDAMAAASRFGTRFGLRDAHVRAIERQVMHAQTLDATQRHAMTEELQSAAIAAAAPAVAVDKQRQQAANARTQEPLDVVGQLTLHLDKDGYPLSPRGQGQGLAPQAGPVPARVISASVRAQDGSRTRAYTLALCARERLDYARCDRITAAVRGAVARVLTTAAAQPDAAHGADATHAPSRARRLQR